MTQIKITHNGQVRKINMTFTTMSELESGVAQLLGKRVEEFSLSYVDDDKDTISLPHNSSVAEFLAFRQVQGTPRIIVADVETVVNDSASSSSSSSASSQEEIETPATEEETKAKVEDEEENLDDMYDNDDADSNQQQQQQQAEAKQAPVSWISLLSNRALIEAVQQTIANPAVADFLVSIGQSFNGENGGNIFQVLLTQGPLVHALFNELLEKYPEVKQLLGRGLIKKIICKIIKFLHKAHERHHHHDGHHCHPGHHHHHHGHHKHHGGGGKHHHHHHCHPDHHDGHHHCHPDGHHPHPPHCHPDGHHGDHHCHPKHHDDGHHCHPDGHHHHHPHPPPHCHPDGHHGKHHHGGHDGHHHHHPHPPPPPHHHHHHHHHGGHPCNVDHSQQIFGKTSNGRPIHFRVCCDGCDSSMALRAKSIRDGFSVDGFIAGNRFKSLTVDDYDLCESCEATKKFHESHGPFMTIPNPLRMRGQHPRFGRFQSAAAARVPTSSSSSSSSSSDSESPRQSFVSPAVAAPPTKEESFDKMVQQGLKMFDSIVKAAVPAPAPVSAQVPSPAAVPSASTLTPQEEEEEETVPELWKSKIELLKTLGFVEWSRYIPILEEEGGDLEHTIGRILALDF